MVTDAGILPGLPNSRLKELNAAGEDMPATIANWRAVIHRLMSEFLSGDARIDPKLGLSTCDNTYCQLQSLCRVGEMVQRQESAQTESAQLDSGLVTP